MPNRFEPIIAEVIRREAGDDPNGGYTNDPTDTGGRTQFGIAEKSNPAAWADNKVTLEEAKEIYFNKYVKGPGYDKIPESHSFVASQLVDFGVNSGPYIATQKLQVVLGQEVDGVFGPATRQALIAAEPRTVGNKLAVERLKMLGRIVAKNPSQAKFISGWINRAVEFIS